MMGLKYNDENLRVFHISPYLYLSLNLNKH